MTGRLIEFEVENFRSLRDVKVPLGALNVLVGPNGAGKTNVLDVFRFLADMVRTDLMPALAKRGGFQRIVFHGGDSAPTTIRIKLKGTWTSDGGATAPDEYEIKLDARAPNIERSEFFDFRGGSSGIRWIGISGREISVIEHGQNSPEDVAPVGIQNQSSGLSALARLSGEVGGPKVQVIANRVADFRVFEVDVEAACRSGRPYNDEKLHDNADNLVSFLHSLSIHHADTWDLLVADAIEVLPQLDGIDFEFSSGGSELVVVLKERGLRRPTLLADASFGTTRFLGLLAMLYDPDPPTLTCIEEIEYGLHPQALELLVERLREAGERTQFVVATHSPTFADRLKPEELIVCERQQDGSSAIPVIGVRDINRIVEASQGLPLGELWFSGALGGDL